ncbi:disintegrin and metalloproteinase domain-containing protein 20-like [Caloenas nicobarica]|uniref:disintegrin and metalloproteinase domain-containing protein 20-like n=1 Tax=Caloenas nicobarica TaxID=187106 RepID=UPI0032B7CEBB
MTPSPSTVPLGGRRNSKSVRCSVFCVNALMGRTTVSALTASDSWNSVMCWLEKQRPRGTRAGLAWRDTGMGTGHCPPPRGVWVTALILLLCPGFTESLRIVYSEVTVPRRLETKERTFSKVDASYLITAEGNHHIVHLTRAKNLIAKDIPVFTYSPEGRLITEFPYIQDDCYYEGFVEGSPRSVASLSTCFGISGVLQIGDLWYEIEPVENSLTFQHLIYRRALENGSSRLCHVAEEHKAHPPEDGEFANGSRKIVFADEVLGPQSLAVPTRYLELALVTNKELFKVKNYNETEMLHMFVSISNLLNTVYKPMKLQVVISAVEVWTKADQVATARSLAQTLQGFTVWCYKDAIGRINYDHIQLLIGEYDEERGFAWKRSMCQLNSMGVVSFPGHDTTGNTLMLAHGIGHSLGFSHDDAKKFHGQFCNCTCADTGCIMRTSPGVCLAFSNCSMAEYYDEVIRKDLPCLHNIPSLKPFLLEACGNGVLDKGEECDCGIDEHCLQEGCCVSSTCLLAPEASCYRGGCCHKCEFRAEGKVCREAMGICDLPEYCNGSSALCPSDVFKQDGTPCGINDRCYDGRCHSHGEQCKALFGKAAQPAPFSCFREVNIRGDRCGNCGWNGTYYTKCQEENVLCGRVQCTNVKRVPVRHDGETVVQTIMNDELCWGLEFHLATDTPDVGSVKDGTSCGRNKICVNRTCVSAAFLDSDCREKKCHDRGVCNNKNNCHCDFGWGPPFCKLEGFGGSIDSGPPPSLYLLRAVRKMGKAVGIFLLFIFILGFLMYKKNSISLWLHRCRRKRQEKQRRKSIPPPPNEEKVEGESSV